MSGSSPTDVNKQALALTTAALSLALVIAGCARSQTGSSPSATFAPAVQALASEPPYVYTLIVGTHYKSQGHDHLKEGDSTDFAYTSDPPTSGPHKDVLSDVFDSPTPLPKYLQASLLEHGNILLQYNCTCPDIALALHRIAYSYDADWIRSDQSDPAPLDAQDAEYEGHAVIVAPYPGMSHVIVMTAWTQLGTLDSVDVVKINDFIHAYLHNASNIAQ